MQKSKKRIYKIKSEVWIYPSQTTPWHFVSVPKKESAEITARFGKRARGFGSLRVMVTIGKTSWKTSIFPDKKMGEYLLPLKADVRKKEGILARDKITFSINILT